MKPLKSVNFLQKVGVGGALGCIPVTIFIGPAVAFPLACVCFGMTASAVISEIEAKRQKSSQEPVATSVTQLLSEFRRLNKEPEVLEIEPSRFEKMQEIKMELEDETLNEEEQQRLEEQHQQNLQDWTSVLEGLLNDPEEGEE